jgi:hypothetical protein
MMRIGQERLRGVAAMAGLANDTTDTPRRRQRRARVAERRAATRVSPCAVRKPGQAGWRDRQTPWRRQFPPRPGCDSYQPARSWRRTPEKPITTGGLYGLSCWAVASRKATRIVISRM